MNKIFIMDWSSPEHMMVSDPVKPLKWYSKYILPRLFLDRRTTSHGAGAVGTWPQALAVEHAAQGMEETQRGGP